MPSLPDDCCQFQISYADFEKLEPEPKEKLLSIAKSMVIDVTEGVMVCLFIVDCDSISEWLRDNWFDEVRVSYES